MKNLSGTPDYATTADLTRKKKTSKHESVPDTPAVLNKEDVDKFVETFNSLQEQCEKLYETRSLKQLHDILASFYSMKNDIRKLTDIINN